MGQDNKDVSRKSQNSNRTLPRLFWEASSHATINARTSSYTYQPLSLARCMFIQLSELEQCRVTNLAQESIRQGSHRR